jgi:hypothetical protein
MPIQNWFTFKASCSHRVCKHLYVAWTVESLCYMPEGRSFSPPLSHLILQLNCCFQTHYGPGVDSKVSIRTLPVS